MFGQPVIILSKPIISAKIQNTCPASVESGRQLNGGGAELISHTHLSPDSDVKVAINHDLKSQKDDVSSVCNVLNKIAEKLNKCCKNIFTQHKEEIARLSVEISRKILVQKIEDGDYKIETIVKEALKSVPTHQDIEVHLNPKDLELCKQAFQNEKNCTLSGIKLIPDPGIGRAECVIKSPKGIVQSFIDEHLEQISEALQKA